MKFFTYENSIKSLKDNLSLKDMQDKVQKIDFINRNIYIDTLSSAVATDIDKVIRFWNLWDKENNISLSAREPIKIHINSSGGLLSAAMSIVDTIKLSTTPVYTINTGIVYKESFYIYLAGIKRYSYPRATFFWDKSISFYKNFLIDSLDEDNQGNLRDFLNSQELELKDLLLENTRITENEYKKKSGWWMTAQKADELNVCNEVLRQKHIL